MTGPLIALELAPFECSTTRKPAGFICEARDRNLTSCTLSKLLAVILLAGRPRRRRADERARVNVDAVSASTVDTDVDVGEFGNLRGYRIHSRASPCRRRSTRLPASGSSSAVEPGTDAPVAVIS